MAKYYFCKEKSDLVNLVVNRVMEVSKMDYPNQSFGIINFKVEDTPTAEEAKGMSEEELAERYETSAGTYGISTVSLFDQEGIQLVMGYYGGTEGIQSVYFDDNYEIDKDDAFEKIFSAINLLLSFEVPVLLEDILVEVSE